MENINNISKQSENQSLMLNSRQIKARFRKSHMAKIIDKSLNTGNIVAHDIAESIQLISVNDCPDFTWGGVPAPHMEVVATIQSDKLVKRSFRLYQDGPRANKMVTMAKRDREISVDSVDSFILELVTDNVFQSIQQ